MAWAAGAATITLSMACLPGDCLSKAGTGAFPACATKGAAALRGTLDAAQSALKTANAALGANVSIGAVTFDCESSECSNGRLGPRLFAATL